MNDYVRTGLLAILVAICVFGIHYVFNAGVQVCFKYFGIKNWTQYRQLILNSNSTPINQSHHQNLSGSILPSQGSGNLETSLSLKQQFAQCFGEGSVPTKNAPLLIAVLLYLAYALLLSGMALSCIGAYKVITKKKEGEKSDAKP